MTVPPVANSCFLSHGLSILSDEDLTWSEIALDSVSMFL